jgi:hypothetical protein
MIRDHKRLSTVVLNQMPIHVYGGVDDKLSIISWEALEK